MRKLENMATKVYIKTTGAIQRFRDSERGDTNFVSIAIVLGIVAVLAGLFFSVGKPIVEKMTQSVQNFVNTIK